MKFRIVEIKNPLCKPKYKPQYKTFLFWYNIANTKFADTIFCNCDFEYDGTVWNIYDAEQTITEFKNYLNSNESYIKIHTIK